MISTPQNKIDWEDAKKRIEHLGELLRQTETYSLEDAEAVLYLRAQLLAQEIEELESPTEGLEAIVVSLGSERYALETAIIREVIRPAPIAPLPGTGNFIKGMMNLRGRPLLVADGRELLGLTNLELSDSARVVILGIEDGEFGILVEATQEVITVNATDILEAPRSVPDAAAPLIRGVTSDAIVIFDSQHLMNDPRLWIDEP